MTIPDLHHRLSDDLERMQRWCSEAAKELDIMKDLAKGSAECHGALAEAADHLHTMRQALGRARIEVEQKSGSPAR